MQLHVWHNIRTTPPTATLSSSVKVPRQTRRQPASPPARNRNRNRSLRGKPLDPGCAQGAARNSPMETSMPSRGTFGAATCRKEWWGPGPVDGSIAIRSPHLLSHSITIGTVAHWHLELWQTWLMGEDGEKCGRTAVALAPGCCCYRYLTGNGLG